MRPTPRYTKGTRLRLWSGEIVTVLVSNDCRLRVRPEGVRVRTFTTRTGAEVTLPENRDRDITPYVEAEVI